MNWLPLLFMVALVAVLFLVRRAALVSVRDAQRLLREGALIVDVRTPEEFTGNHVPGALNLPLSELPGSALSRFARDKVLLLHCQAGGRSEVARQRLRAQGYLHVHNLGSLARAQRIASSCPELKGGAERDPKIT